MALASIAQPNQINNHELQKLVEQVVEILKLSIVQGINATMNPQVYKCKPKELTVGTVNYPSVALVVAERIKSLDQQRLNPVRLALGRNRSITSAIRAGGIDIRSEKSITEQIDVKKLFAFVNGTTFSEAAMEQMVKSFSVITSQEVTPIEEAVLNDLRSVDIKYGGVLPENWLEGFGGRLMSVAANRAALVNLNKQLKFRVHEIKCIDETDPEWAGSDTISWGGVTIDDKEATSKIPEKLIGDFNDSDSKIYNPPEIVSNFSLDNTYPKKFLVTMALAEKDSGGMSEFIQKLYEATKAQITLIITALGAAAGAAIGAEVGGTVGTVIGGPLGTIIGVAAGAILGALIAWLASVLQDDIFPPQASALFLYSASDAFPGGGLVSPRQELCYRDHGGDYRITYDWEIIR